MMTRAKWAMVVAVVVVLAAAAGRPSFASYNSPASANPTNIVSGGTTQLDAPSMYWVAIDSWGGWMPIEAWHWDDGGGGGTFWPYADAQNPTWTGPGNATGTPVQRTLTVSYTVPASPYAGERVTVTEDTAPHLVSVAPSADPTTVKVGAASQLSATATDGYGHTMFAWLWSDGGAAGSFAPGPESQIPLYWPPASMAQGGGSVVLSVTATCTGTPAASGTGSVTLIVEPQQPPPPPATATFPDVPTTYWAYAYIEACCSAGIVQGYPDGTYRPEENVTRAQMAVYIARALKLTQ